MRGRSLLRRASEWQPHPSRAGSFFDILYPGTLSGGELITKNLRRGPFAPRQLNIRSGQGGLKKFWFCFDLVPEKAERRTAPFFANVAMIFSETSTVAQ